MLPAEIKSKAVIDARFLVEYTSTRQVQIQGLSEATLGDDAAEYGWVILCIQVILSHSVVSTYQVSEHCCKAGSSLMERSIDMI